MSINRIQAPAELGIVGLGTQCKAFFMLVVRALQESRAHEARRVIDNYAHLLPENVKPPDIPPSIAVDRSQLTAANARIYWRSPAALLAIIPAGIGTVFLLREAGSFLSIDFTLLLKITSVFVGSLVAGVAGFAFSAVSGAILLHWVAPTSAVPLLLACSITTQLFCITKLWRTMRWRQCAPFLVGGFIGIPVGAKLLEDVDPHTFAGAFGVCLICYVAFMLLRPRTAAARGSRFADVAAGFAGGITGGSFAFPGAVPTIWCSIRGLAKDEQRGIVQPFILLMQIATLVYFSKLGMIASGMTATYLLCAPAVLGGTWLGLHLFKNIGDAMFRHLVLTFLVVSGVFLIV